MKSKNKISGSIKFLIVVLIIYSIIAVVDFSLAKEALWEFLLMLVKIIPVLFIVLIFMVLANIYFDQNKIKKYLGVESGIKGWFYAVISGILVSGPPYILFPLLGKLRKEGMKDSLLAVFLYNRNVEIAFVPAMIYYFGLAFTLVLSAYIIIFSILNGKIINWFMKKTIH
jgi:uncharacterized membrane protein YraQ (UPF0718 family)